MPCGSKLSPEETRALTVCVAAFHWYCPLGGADAEDVDVDLAVHRHADRHARRGGEHGAEGLGGRAPLLQAALS